MQSYCHKLGLSEESRIAFGGGGGELGTNTHRLSEALIIISLDLRFFLAGDSASRLSVCVAASRMRASGRASELARDGDKRKKEQGKKRSKRREALLQKRPSLSPAKRLLVGKFYLTGVSLYWAHFTSLQLDWGQNENQLQFCFVYLTRVSLLAALHSAELGRTN